MAVKLNDTSKGILGKASEKIGSYSEAPGGGTPLAKGEKAPSKEWVDAHRKMQPRDEDGQFTYNSANGKGLKYGPSRGTTVPPFLKGIKLTYCAPGTKLKIEGDGGIKVKIMTIDMSVEEIVSSCKSYIESEEGFAGMGKGSSIDKMGRKSKAEKEAEAGQAGFVDTKTLSAGTQKKMDDAKKEYEKDNSRSESPVNPTVDGYKVLTDILNSDGSTTKVTPARYWERNKKDKMEDKVPSSAPTPTPKADETKIPTPTPTPSKKDESSSDEKILDSMGLDKSEIKGEEMSFNSEDTKDGRAFYSKYKSTIDSMVKEFNSKYPDTKIGPKHIIQAIRSGKLKSMDAWKKSLSK
ncbi:MAG: hypothetical protein IKF82_01325 [Bacilli bacterium]|nr:hypothetical protein [Bacilli bacterium]